MKKIIWRTVELITFAIGTFIFVANILAKSPAGAGIGAFMIVFGFLLQSWKSEQLIKKEN